MGLKISRVTPFKADHPIFDGHCHIIKRKGVFTSEVGKRIKAYDIDWEIFAEHCSVEEAYHVMKQTGIRVALGKNLAASPTSVPAANNFAIEVENAEKEKEDKTARIMPAGSIHLGYNRNLQEIERLKKAGIRFITIDSSVQCFNIDDPGMRKAYRLMAQAGIIAHFHTGPDAGGSQNHLTLPDQIIRVKEMAPGLVIIAEHLGSGRGYNLIRRYERYKNTPGLFFGAAWAPEETYFDWGSSSEKEVRDIVLEVYGEDWVIYGSDWGWGDPGRQLAFWLRILPKEAFLKITFLNARDKLGIPIPATA